VENRTAFACQEREELVQLLEQLTAEQWDHETLCAGWRVRDVVAHVFSYDDLSGTDVARRLAQAGFRFDRVNAVCLAEHAGKAPAELTALARGHLRPRGLAAGFRGAIALVDGMIHTQDIRRPLGLPRRIPTDRLTSALEFAKTSPAIHALRHRRGVRMVATDLDWAAGRGPEVRGTGEALLMVLAGRPGPVAELQGPGQPLLARRLRRG
jgi:uncharacterized protein (TIGR03083 family)